VADGHQVDPARVDPATVGRIFRQESGRSVATLIRIFGDIDIAEDAVQEAFAIALRRWPVGGLPPNPGAWITTTARNRAIDGLRRAARERELLGEVAATSPDSVDVTSLEEQGAMYDDRLRLIFTCCHPALAADARVALTLRLLGGLTTAEVAAAFLVAEPTMAKRLTRAKHKIKAARVPYRVPDDHELPARLPQVLAVVYLIYAAGLDGRNATELTDEAIRLARLLSELMPDEPEVSGLLALVLLVEARRPSRTALDGSIVLLADQDRSLWDRSLLRRNQPGPYQIQAAIQAVHADAPTFQATDWPQIVALYDQLLAMAPTPVIALNRAIAVAEVDGPAAALALVDTLELDGYHAFHAARADLLWRLDRPAEAASSYRRASQLAPTDAEREFLRGGGRSRPSHAWRGPPGGRAAGEEPRTAFQTPRGDP